MKPATGQYRNQRLGRPKARKQQHLLEVSIRRDKERSLQLKRLVTTVFKVVLIGDSYQLTSVRAGGTSTSAHFFRFLS